MARDSLLLLKDLKLLETINIASVPVCNLSLIIELVKRCKGLRTIVCSPSKSEREASAIVRAWGPGAAMRTTSADCTFELTKAWLCDQERRKFYAEVVGCIES